MMAIDYVANFFPAADDKTFILLFDSELNQVSFEPHTSALTAHHMMIEYHLRVQDNHQHCWVSINSSPQYQPWVFIGVNEQVQSFIEPEKITFFSLPHTFLHDRYHLNEYELRVCQAFVNAPSLEQVQSLLGLSLSTVRTYLKNIYQKTGQRSQTELLRLLLLYALQFY